MGLESKGAGERAAAQSLLLLRSLPPRLPERGGAETPLGAEEAAGRRGGGGKPCPLGSEPGTARKSETGAQDDEGTGGGGLGSPPDPCHPSPARKVKAPRTSQAEDRPIGDCQPLQVKVLPHPCLPPPHHQGAPNSLASAAARALDVGTAAMAPHAGQPGLWGPLPGLLLVAVALSRPAAPCPFQCYCFGSPKLLLRCASGAELRQPPRDVPPDARNLTIVGANLTVLRAAAFAGGDADGDGGEEATDGVRLPLLTALRLTHNNIEVVEDGAFDGLPSLAALDLSHNPLRALGGGAFRGLPALRSLQLNHALLRGRPALLDALDAALASLTELRLLGLADNALSRLPPAALRLPRLEQLDARLNALDGLSPDELRALERDGGLPGPRLLLADNPLRCGCASRPLLAWLRNATERVPDARRLRCASPPPLHDRPLLDLDEARLRCADGDAKERGEEVDVASPELEASYVFFGLVLALIGLIFLMVLYLNRRGIQRWMRNLREACRDQMEGYHYRYEQDADPRRAPAPAAPAGSRATSPGSGL